MRSALGLGMLCACLALALRLLCARFLNLQVQKSWEDTPLANILVADFLVSFAIVVLVSLPTVKILMKSSFACGTSSDE